jgi:hypothetical protein
MLYFETMIGYSNYIQKKVSGLTDGQSCQAIDSFLRGVYINFGEIFSVIQWLEMEIVSLEQSAFPCLAIRTITSNLGIWQ